ncbi:unnamed protein product [Symbiodinium natans]|uniref:Ion transport domain-containing protein n=1 Tax=Symbiodinium natans TaxID=878477 RepID=A0A812RNC6_9DINO|nr:unnamed protein product [Symbiodinium natans]
MFGGRKKKSESTQHTRRRFGVAALGADDEDSEIDGGNFYPHGFAKWNVVRQKTWRVISSEKTDWILAVMILSSVVILIVDADLTVKSPRSPEEEILQAIANYITGAYTCVYAAEMTARLYVFRTEVFKTALLFDFLIVAADVLLLIADLVLEGFAFELGFLRVFRLARLFRFVRVVGMFPELQFLIKGFISSFSAVFWGSILMWIVILMWAIVAVYFIQPVNQEIVAATGSEECERDCRAWSSVWYSEPCRREDWACAWLVVTDLKSTTLHLSDT